ncbi:MIR domain-containing protein [Ornithinimicrobium sufpigmenti]|uniref:MIR domain-containing protein n=1 Tax=Ornithinimicrobium sufpigmenti TaxID=2508882 RepID=UPI0015E15DB8|nr:MULTISPECIES: MIR domain-containing protein [unclassified Ornithinimicrobium]
MAHRLEPGQSLTQDQQLTSPNGRTSLVMQGDGNLVLYESVPPGRVAVWASATDGRSGARVVMQGDGNLVVIDAGNTPRWDSGTWGNPGSALVLQDDGNLVVYAPDGRALWSPNTYRRTGRVPFVPATHGFAFSNQFVNNVATIPGHGQVTTRGRCGGMAYAALDYFLAGVPVPAQQAGHFTPSKVPPDRHWLADYIYARLMNSFFTGSALKFAEWTVHSDHETWFYKGVTRWTKEEQFPLLRSRINAGQPVVLGLIRATNLADIGSNHQVVGYGYESHDAAGTQTVYIYDNNHPGQEVALRSHRGQAHFVASTGEVWRGFFVQDYSHRNPPVFTRSPAAMHSRVLYGSTVKLSHTWTGRTLHSHALNYGHPGSSRQQQVTAFEGADDNDLWRVKAAHGQPDNHQDGQPVRHGDTVRLEHVLTRRNLHSHSGHPSPVTRQQEVTCFGQGGVGDGNDNWRVELERPGEWTAQARVRLIHQPTNHALHSHAGHSHPQWTAGQQEVTAFRDRDSNDWWTILEIR